MTREKREQAEVIFFLFYMIGLLPLPYYHLDNLRSTNTLGQEIRH